MATPGRRRSLRRRGVCKSLQGGGCLLSRKPAANHRRPLFHAFCGLSCNSSRLGAFCGPLGGFLGVCLRSRRRPLERKAPHVIPSSPSWAVLGASWAILGPSWAVVGRRWAVRGPSWGPVGPSGSPLRPSLGVIFVAVLGRLGLSWASRCGFLGRLGLKKVAITVPRLPPEQIQNQLEIDPIGNNFIVPLGKFMFRFFRGFWISKPSHVGSKMQSKIDLIFKMSNSTTFC